MKQTKDVHRSLQTQMWYNYKMKANSNYLERKGDLDNLNTAMKTYVFE